MAFPLLPLIFGGGALVAVLVAARDSSAAPKPPAPPAPPPSPEPHPVDPSVRRPAQRPGATQPAVVAVDPGMPAQAVAELQRVLATTSDPDRLEALAQLLEQAGYIIAAATVRAHAAAMRARGAGAVVQKIETVITSDTPPPAPPTMPTSFDYKIKSTEEVPYILAKRFTGDANRWREIMPLNPTFKVIQKKNPTTGKVTTLIEPWYPGLVVKLPGSWIAAAMASRVAA